MFIVAHFPFGDFRPLIPGERGRLAIPDWASDDLNSGFVRGFGKISRRNASNLGLGGERSFADTNSAVRFIERIELRQEGTNLSMRIVPWFRRLYFDGRMAGRFEFGFLVVEHKNDQISVVEENGAINPSLLAKEVLSSNIQVNSVDGSKQVVKFFSCSRALGFAYIASTTNSASMNLFPVEETFRTAVFVGKPMVHIRVSSGRAIERTRDRRVLTNANEPTFFITSARGSNDRSNVFVQASEHGAKEESSDERTTRVMFAHLNSVLFAYSQFVHTGPTIGGTNKKAVFRIMIERMIQQFQQIQQWDKSDTDVEFAAAMKRFAAAYAGRVDELAAKLEALSEEWNKPTTIERFKAYGKGIQELILRTAVETAVKSTLKEN